MNIHHFRLLAALLITLASSVLVLSMPQRVDADSSRDLSTLVAAPQQQPAPPLLSNITAIATSGRHTCTLTANGGVKCWGRNSHGQLGDGTTAYYRRTPVDVSGLSSGVQAIAAGEDHTCALTVGGGVKCWGRNGTIPVDVQGLSSGVQAIATNGSSTCALTASGGVKCWGSSGMVPVDVQGLSSGVQAIADGHYHTCALTTGGGVKCWGDNSYGQLGDGTYTDRQIPVDVSGLSSGVRAISAAEQHTCALTTGGGVKCWGSNGDGQLGDGTTTSRTTPVDVQGLSSGVQAITVGGAFDSDVGGHHTCALTIGGGVKCWGDNYFGQLGDGTTTSRTTAVDVQGLSSGVQAIAAAIEHTCALMTSGRVKCWGSNHDYQLGDDGMTIGRLTPVDVQGLSSGVQTIAVGGGYYGDYEGDRTCVLTTDGEVKCWGRNNGGQLGDGTTFDRWTPLGVSGLSSGVQAISTGGHHSCALTTGGGVKCWGRNYSGQLGDGTATDRWTPVNVAGLTSGAQAVMAGDSHTCTLTVSGGVKCWGGNYYGQLGDGTTVYRRTPVNVSGLSSEVQAIFAGEEHTCALMSGGGVKCWGGNQYGQLGDGTTTNRLTPVDVIGLTSGVQIIAAGVSHTCALTTSGEVKCWGENRYGQLGDGTNTNRLTAVSMSGLSDATSITTGRFHTCALTVVGGVKCWGGNQYGQLGDDTTTDRWSLVNVSGLSNGVQAIAARWDHTCALTTGGRVKCWGENNSGQLGVNPGWTPVDVIDPAANETVVCAAVSPATGQYGPPFCAPIVLEVPVVYTDTHPSEALHGNTGTNRGKVNSWFDHTYPTYDRLPNGNASFVTIWTGTVFPNDNAKGISWYDGHNGVDFAPLGVTAAEKALPAMVVAAAGGVVKSVDDIGRGDCKGEYGCFVTIDHDNKYLTRYAHLEQGSIKVNVGYPVSPMHFLGLMGNTSSITTTKKHLHFGVYYDKNDDGIWGEYTESVDPFGWVPGLSSSGEIDPWETSSGMRSTFLWKNRMSVQNTINPEGGTTQSASAFIGISVPPGAIDAALTFEVIEGPLAEPSAELRSAGRSFLLQVLEWLPMAATPAIADVALDSSFNQPISLTVSYSDDEIRHLDESRLNVAQWNQVDGQWMTLPTQVNLQQNIVVAQATEPGGFDLQGPLQCADDNLESNDDAYTASLFTPEVSGAPQRFDVSSDEDWYRLDTDSWELYNFTVTALTSGTQGNLTIFAPDGVTQLAAASVQEFSWIAPSDNVYYVRLTPASGSEIGCNATYTLSITSEGVLNQLFMPIVQR